jgi:C4-dicarboxylate transporter, DctM subunit
MGPLFWLLLLVILALLRAPLFTIFAAVAMLAFSGEGIDSSAVIIDMFRMTSMQALIAIPLFTFAGYMLAESKTPQRLINLSRAFLGWLPGGLAIAALLTCAVFTAFTGASGVTIVALGGLLYPILVKEKYPERFSLGLMTTSGSLGLLFPPSLPIILYGIIAEVSIDKLFIAGLLPGIVLVVLLSLYAVRTANRTHVERHKFERGAAIKAVKEAAWEIPLPFLLLGGLYGGFFTATEAAAITAFYVFVVEVFIYRDLKIFTDVPRVMKESMLLVGAILIIVGCALSLTGYLIDQQVTQKLFELIKGFISSKWVFLIALNLFLLVVGMMMDIFSAIIVVVPLVLPIARYYGIDPIHLGIIFLANLEIGYLTPPFGLNLFISSFRFEKSYVQVFRSVVIFIGLLIVALMIITYVPGLSLWLVDLLKVK